MGCSHCFVCSFLHYTVGVFSMTCNHMRAPAYYTASVENKCSWKAYPCSTYAQFLLGFCKKCNCQCPTLGYNADETKTIGKYYLKTNSEEPFCGRSNCHLMKYFVCVCVILIKIPCTSFTRATIILLANLFIYLFI